MLFAVVGLQTMKTYTINSNDESLFRKCRRLQYTGSQRPQLRVPRGNSKVVVIIVIMIIVVVVIVVIVVLVVLILLLLVLLLLLLLLLSLSLLFLLL